LGRPPLHRASHPSLHVRTASRGDARVVLSQAPLRHAAPRRVDDPPSRHECRRAWLFCMPCTRPYAPSLCVLTLFAYSSMVVRSLHDTHCHTRTWANSHASVGWEMSRRQVPRTTDCAQRGGSVSHPLCGVQGELHAATTSKLCICSHAAMQLPSRPPNAPIMCPLPLATSSLVRTLPFPLLNFILLDRANPRTTRWQRMRKGC
jgi:hypothetical protein